MKIDTIVPGPSGMVSGADAIRLAPLLVGIAALALPTLIDLAQQVWTTDAGTHGVIVLFTGLWLIVQERGAITGLKRPGSFGLFLATMLPALAIYIFGRAFGYLFIEVTALFGALLSLGYLYYGTAVLRHLWFPILYLAFLIPPPGWVIDWFTAPMKIWISTNAAELLQRFDYPIVQIGATLYVDQYQLLVEDACAGLNSIVSLTAIGLFYIYLLHRASWRYSLFLLAWIIPMAILANFVRVVALVLITYHGGDEMAQGFLHSTAGILMFITALLGIFAVDALVSPIRRKLSKGQAR